MGREGGALAGLDARGVNGELWRDGAAESITLAVRHGVVDEHVPRHRGEGGLGDEVRHRLDERRRDREPAGVHVVFHVVVGEVREDDPRPRRPDDARHAPQVALVVEDHQIAAHALVKRGAEKRGSVARLAGPDPRRLSAVGDHAAAVTVGNIAIVDLPASLGEEQQRAGGDKLDVVWMGHQRERPRTLREGNGGHSWLPDWSGPPPPRRLTAASLAK